MCGRYTVFDEESIIEMRRIIREVEANFTPDDSAVQGSFTPDGQASFAVSPIQKGEIRPTDTVPVLFPGLEGCGYTPLPMRWGFPRPGDKQGVVFNARSETAHTLPMFRRCLAERRIVVPSTGFYEWDHHGASRTRYLFRPRGEAMLYMAGIFNLFCDGFTEYPAFVILTRPADEVVGRYHDRMPVVIAKDNLSDWLHNDRATRRLLHAPANLQAISC
ncbi:MAG: SOS response-associated peptidase family protein [Clostridia bacterium]|nr:SOS response-associated peptidase family protein [Clostridia bacterium]